MNELYLDKNFLIYQLLVVSEGHKLGLVDTNEYKKLIQKLLDTLKDTIVPTVRS